MDAVKFFEERERMCSAAGKCENCPMSAKFGIRFTNCVAFSFNRYKEVIEFVEQWAKEHPQKTIMDDFFEKHPNAQKDRCGFPYVCAINLGYVEKCIEETPERCKKCWSQSMEESK